MLLIYISTFIVAFVTLSTELLLTRILSVTTWYHFAFFAVSVALFGLTVGGLFIFFSKSVIDKLNPIKFLLLISILFSTSIPLVIIFQLKTDLLSFAAPYYFISSLPFILGGSFISFVLYKFTSKASILYAADLLGSGLGSLSIVILLPNFGLSGTIFTLISLSAVAPLALALKNRSIILNTLLAIWLIIIAVFIFNSDRELFQIKGIYKNTNEQPVVERWNSYSRVAVSKYEKTPFGWGLSENIADVEIDQYMLTIDSSASTPITRFDGDLQKVEYLKHDVTALGYYLVDQPKVFIIGAGGGRDILTALSFNASRVDAAEYNEIIVQIVEESFGDFSGRLFEQENVSVYVDEARNLLLNRTEKYDLIQSSLTDTWAAFSANALSLTENSIYTKDAWKIFLKHLNEEGVLSVSRWYLNGNPAEMLRLTNLGIKAMEDSGITNIKDKIIVVKNKQVGNLLLSKRKFTNSKLNLIKKQVEKEGFETVYLPGGKNEELFEELITSPNKVRKISSSVGADLSAPTDNRPFFFQLKGVGQLFNPTTTRRDGTEVLMTLLIVLTSLTIFLVLLPLLFIRKKLKFNSEKIKLAFYFMSIAMAFIFLEIGLFQRLSVNLGKPQLTLVFVLSTILIGAGIGSFMSKFVRSIEKPHLFRFGVILALVWLFNFIFVNYVAPGLAVNEITKVLSTLMFLTPLGFLMGFFFPIGLKLANMIDKSLIPWFWALNGSFSVLGAVLAVLIAILFGINSILILSMVFYLIAIKFVYSLNSTK